MARFGQRAYVDPLAQQPIEPRPARDIPHDPLNEKQAQETEFRPRSIGPNRRYRPGNATINAATPVGAAGVKQYHAFPPDMIFALDYEAKAVPPPNVTQAVRRSIFQPLQQIYYHFQINPGWGRGGRYGRFSFINEIADTGNAEAKLNAIQTGGAPSLYGTQAMRPRRRYTKVLQYPRNDTTPQTYGADGGYGT